MLVNEYGTGERVEFEESSLGMVLGTTLGAEVGSRKGSTDVFSGVNGDAKPEDSCLGVTMGES